jgi:type I restriction enzyme S subunit
MSESVAEADAKQENVARLGPRQVPIPDDWNAVPFEDAIELNPSYEKPNEGPLDYLPMDAVDEGMQTIEYWDQREKEDCTTTWFKNGDTVYAKITPCTENGKIAFIEDLSTEVGSGSTEFLVFHPREGVTDERFVYYLANLPEFRAVTISLMEGSTGRQRVPTDVFSGGLEVPLPPLPEQRRIADVLSTIDERIQQAHQRIEETEELRQGLLQELIIGRRIADEYKEVRLGAKSEQIPVDWDVKTFSDVADVEKGNTPKTSNDDYYGGDITWVTPDDLSGLYERGEKYISDSDRKLTPEGLDSTSVNIVDAPSVMFTSRSYGIGKTAICTTPAATNQGIIAFHCGDEMGEEYLYYYLNYIMPYIISISGVSTFPEVSLTDIRELKVPVPTESDRQYIENVLTSAEDKLVDEKSTKQTLQELKRGLMQDLLTGKRRLDTGT